MNTISEYIQSLDKTPFLKEYPDLIATGFRAITHIFNMNLLNSQSLEIAYFSSQKAHIYYIEYLTQTQYDLNPSNAVLFIYNKSLIERPRSNAAIYPLEPRISKIAELVYWWENSDIIQSKIPKSLICDFLISENPNLSFYLEIIQKRDLSHDEYIRILPKLLTLSKSPFQMRDLEDIEPYNLWVSKIME